MDDTGDGKLESEELRTGFTKIFNNPQDRDDEGKELYQKIWTDQELNQIIGQVDHDGNGYIDWRDFLLASVDLSEQSFKKYCQRAFERFFINETFSIQTGQLYDLMCSENIFKKEYVMEIINKFDEDGSDTIQFHELIGILLEFLENDIHPRLTYDDIRADIKKRFDLELKPAEPKENYVAPNI